MMSALNHPGHPLKVSQTDSQGLTSPKIGILKAWKKSCNREPMLLSEGAELFSEVLNFSVREDLGRIFWCKSPRFKSSKTTSLFKTSLDQDQKTQRASGTSKFVYIKAEPLLCFPESRWPHPGCWWGTTASLHPCQGMYQTSSEYA